jgi:hypothetical protein
MDEYRIQLDEIERKLEEEPGNEDLKSLRDDLQLLMQLQLEQQTQVVNAKKLVDLPDKPQAKSAANEDDAKEDSGISKNEFSVNEVVHHKTDEGKWFEGRVESIVSTGKYVVYFPVTSQSELIDGSRLRRPKSSSKYQGQSGGDKSNAGRSRHRVAGGEFEEKGSAGGPIRKKQTFQDHLEKKEREQSDKQNAWKQFSSSTKMKTFGRISKN